MTANLSKKHTERQPTKTTIPESERAGIIANFRASYPFRKDVTDDEIINNYSKESTPSNTITVQPTPIQISKPQTVPLTSNTITPPQPTVNRIDEATLTFWKNQTRDAIYQWSCRLTTESHKEKGYLSKQRRNKSKTKIPQN